MNWKDKMTFYGNTERLALIIILCVPLTARGQTPTQTTEAQASAAALLIRSPTARAVVTGAGEGSFHADIDDDGDIDGSYFGIAVHQFKHGRQSWIGGHFVCAMWGKTDVLNLPLMAVEGVVVSATTDPKKRVVTFHGVGTVDLGSGPSGFYNDVPFDVRVVEGGPGIGSIQLTVIGAFDGVPGDTKVGNNNYDLPVEKVMSGHILVH
jgi:hypothetical protein